MSIMKKYLGILSVLTFACTLLYGFSSVWARSEILDVLNAISENAKKEELEEKEQKEKEELKERNQKKQEDFEKKVKEIIKKLPDSAKVAVPAPVVKWQIPEGMEDLEEALKKLSENFSEDMQLRFENLLEEAGVKIVERDAFKEIEKEIVYSQTGEIDSANSAKFGKAVGATHMFLNKISFSGLETEHAIVTIALRVVEVESMLRVGTAIVDIEQPKTKKLSSPHPSPQTLVSETFKVSAQNSKDYSWVFKSDGSLEINLSANSDVNLYIVDIDNYKKFAAGKPFRGFAVKERITSANFSVALMKGGYFIIVSNKHSLFTTAGVSLVVSYTPKD